MKNLVENILKELKLNPVIPCTSNFDDVAEGKYSRTKIVLLYDTTIFDLINLIKKNGRNDKTVILNIDMVKGISADEFGLRFIKDYIKIDIVTTSSPKIINSLRKLNFLVMQTIFIMDTKSLKKGLELIKTGKPDFLDVRPGILYPKTASLIKENFDIPTICSGFINSEAELNKILDSGAAGITTSLKDLWPSYN